MATPGIRVLARRQPLRQIDPPRPGRHLVTPVEPALPWSEVAWKSLDCGQGWWSLIRDLDRDLKEIYPDYRVGQVKEKFGGLRFYIDAVPEPVFDALQARIREAEAAASRTCEECGHPGAGRVRRGWYRTLCNEDNVKWQNS